MKHFPRKKYNCVIFDCDGVLVDSEIIASQVSLRMLKPFGFEMEPAEYAKTFAGKVEEDILRIIKEHYKIILPQDFNAKLRLEIEHGLDHELQPITGAKDTITQIPLQKAVVSNSRLARVLHSLKIAGLTSLFDKNIFSAEMVKRPKPHPDLYLYAATELKVSPSECLVVEDSLTGITAAYTAGMDVIGFLGASHIYNEHEQKAKHAGAFTTSKDMGELNEIIQDLLK